MSPVVRNTIVTVSCIMISFLLSSCWDRKEINELAIINMIGIDKKKNQLELYYQSINPAGISAKQGGGDSAPVYTYKVTGSSTHASYGYEVSDILPRQLFPDHYRTLVLSENYARNGISILINSYEQQISRRANVEIVVTDSPMNQIMNTFTPLEKIPGKAISSIIEIQSKGSARAIKNSRFKDLIENVESTKATVVNFIRMNKENADNTTKNLEMMDAYARSFILDGGAVFLHDKMIGKISINDIKWFHFLTGNIEFFLQHLTVNGHPVEVEVGKSKVKKSFVISGGIPVLTFQITSDLRIRSDNIPKKTELEKVKQIENAFNKAAEKEALKFIKSATSKGWDLLGLNDRISYQKQKAWKIALQRDPDLWKKTRFVINVESVLSTPGTLFSPYTWK